MIKSLRATRRLFWLGGWVFAAAVFAFSGREAAAEECRLPDSAELSTFSPEAIRLYGAAVRALDRIDYLNACNYLSKASQLQPNAVSLNLLTAAVALKHGRTKMASEARGYYETAITCYRNVLRQVGLTDDDRRLIDNRMRIAMDEQNNLAQRDARREGMGGQFIMNFNREYGSASATPSVPTPGPVPAPPVGMGTYPGVAGMPGMPGMPGMAPGQPMMYPPGSVGGQPYMPGMPAPAYPGGMPGMQAPVYPGAMPGMPGPNVPPEAIGEPRI